MPEVEVRLPALAVELLRALTEHGDETELVDAADYIVPDSLRRSNDRRPATVTVVIPDEVVVSLRGNDEMRGRLVMAWIPRVVLDDLNREPSTLLNAAGRPVDGAPSLLVPEGVT